jgi:proteasome accessory factor B
MRLTAWLLQQREPVTVEQVREAFPDFYRGGFDARDRKWTRDKQALLAAGVPIRHLQDEELGDGYLVDPRAYYLPDLRFTPEEAAVVWTAGLAASQVKGNPWREDLQSALQKLAAGSADLPSRAPSLRIRQGDGVERRRLARMLDALGDAVRRQKRVAIEYFTWSRNETTRREVDVYGFAWRRGTWLLAGHCHLRRGLRVFYVDRVRSLKVNGKEPAKADYRIPRDFDIRVFSRQMPWDYWEHEPREAVVRFTGGLAPIAAQLLPRARLERARDGAVLAHLAVRSLPALVRQALSFGPEAELLSPEDGRAMAREMLAHLSTRLAGREGAVA